MRKKLIFLGALFCLPLAAQQRIYIIDKTDENAALFDENNRYSLINIVKKIRFTKPLELTPHSTMYRSYMRDADRERATISQWTQTFVKLDENGEELYKDTLVNGEIYQTAVTVDTNYTEYCDLSNIKRLVIYKDWMSHPITGERYYGIKTIGFAKKYPGEKRYDVVLKVPADELFKMEGVQFLHPIEREKIDNCLFIDDDLEGTLFQTALVTKGALDSNSVFFNLYEHQKDAFEKSLNGEPYKSLISNGCYGPFCDQGFGFFTQDESIKKTITEIYSGYQQDTKSTFYCSSKSARFDRDLSYHEGESPYTDWFSINNFEGWNNDSCLIKHTFVHHTLYNEFGEDSIITTLQPDGSAIQVVQYYTDTISEYFWNYTNPSNYYVQYDILLNPENQTHAAVPVKLYATKNEETREVALFGVELFGSENKEIPYYIDYFRDNIRDAIDLTAICSWKHLLIQNQESAREITKSRIDCSWTTKSVKKFLKEFNPDEEQWTPVPSGMMF